MVALLLALQLRTITIDQRLAADAHVRIGDTLTVSSSPNTVGDSVIVSAIVGRRADPSEIARSEYRVHLHLDELQHLIGYGDRVDRFAVATHGDSAADSAVSAINDAAFGFRAYRSRDIAVETSETFAVVSRFHRAIGIITIVASSVFLLCILLLKVDERRRDVAALRLLGISRRSVMLTVVLEAAFVSVIGSGVGVGIGWVTSLAVNWHYQQRYQTPLRFALVTGDIVLFAVSLSLVLGIVAGALAARRLVRTHPLVLLGR
jgi:putative ABC transport system permease protein